MLAIAFLCIINGLTIQFFLNSVLPNPLQAELHHHLSGSIRNSSLLEFVKENRIKDRNNNKGLAVDKDIEEQQDVQDIRDMSYFHAQQPRSTTEDSPSAHHTAPHRSLSDCFKIFDLIHRHVHSTYHVKRIVQEMLADAVADGVTYLEMRTTPRQLRDWPGAAAAGAGAGAAVATTSCILVPAGCRVNNAVLLRDTEFQLDAPIDAALSHYVQVVVFAMCEFIGKAGTARRGGSSSSSGSGSGSGSSAGDVDPDVTNEVHAPTHYCASLVARLILSMNRTEAVEKVERVVGVALAWQQVHVATHFVEASNNATGMSLNASGTRTILFSPVVVGLEVSGDPTRGDLPSLLDKLTMLLGSAGSRKLPVSIHAGEVMNVRETQYVLNWQPDRLGHMCVLSHTTAAELLSGRIPLEMCPTSNSLTLHLPDLSHHPQLRALLLCEYPLCICTDDAGVFEVTLSQELDALQTSFQLTDRQVCLWVAHAILFYIMLCYVVLLMLCNAAEPMS